MQSAGKARRRIFYGWWIVSSSALLNLYTGGSFFYGSAAFFGPILEEFPRWGRGITSLAASLRSVEMGVAAPFIGFLADKLGPRKLVFTGSVIAGIGFILWSHVNSLWTFYAAFLVISLGLSACSAATMMTAVANWFRRRVSLAMGLMMAGFGASGIMIPLIGFLIDRFEGWRTPVLMLGIGMFIFGLPVALVIRHRPEPYGWLPDGEQPSSSPRSAVGELSPVPVEEEFFTAREALRTRAFWMISLAIFLQSMVLQSVIWHDIRYLRDLGFSPDQARWVAAFVPLLSVAGRLGFGWLGDKFEKRFIMASAFSLQVGGMLLFTHLSLSRFWLVFPFLLLFGVGYGGTIPLRAAMQREYFGRKHFGAVQGLMMVLLTFGGIIGPPVAGWVFDARGGYYPIWLIFGCLLVLAIPLALLAARPARKTGPLLS